MHLRPSTLNEISATFGVSLPLIFVGLLAANGVDLAVSQIMTVTLLFLMPAFSLGALVGFFMTGKDRAARFISSLSVSALVSLIIVSLVPTPAWFLVALIYFVAHAVGAAFTYFYLLREN